jgi:hypothetical protein
MESNIQHVQTKQDWTASEEAIVGHIMATETMHDPQNYTGDRRINCTRAEALRRLQRRKVGGVYRGPHARYCSR